MRNKFLSIVLCLLIILGISACKRKEDVAEDKSNHIIISAIVKGNFIGEEGLTDEIITSLEDIQENEDISIRFFEVADESNYEVVIEEAINEGASLILMPDPQKQALDIIENIADKYPNVKFGLFGASLDKKNIASAVFNNNESAFLAGYVAAKTSKTKSIGFINMKNDESTENYRVGYIAGAKYADKETKVEVYQLDEESLFNDSYDAVEKLKEEYKVDVVYHKADLAGKSIIEAAENLEIYVIGSEKDQSYLSSKYVIASTVKNINLPLKNMVKEAIKGKFKQTHTIYNLSNEGVDLKDRAGNLNSQLLNEINKIKEDIKSGKINPPNSQESLDKFIEKL